MHIVTFQEDEFRKKPQTDSSPACLSFLRVVTLTRQEVGFQSHPALEAPRAVAADALHPNRPLSPVIRGL